MDAETIALKTSLALTNNGYCFWKCDTLKGETIAIVKNGENTFYRDRALDRAKELCKLNKLTEIPYVYTTEELSILCETDAPTLLHEAKKMGAILARGE